jgi:hypothetical protein
LGVCLGVGLAAAGWDGLETCFAAGSGADFAIGLSIGCLAVGFAGAFGVGLTANFSGGLDGPSAAGGETDAGCAEAAVAAGAAAAVFGNLLRISRVASSLMELEGLFTAMPANASLAINSLLETFNSRAKS